MWTEAKKRKLEALQKEREEAEAADRTFFKEVKKRKDEVLKVLGVDVKPATSDVEVQQLRDSRDKYKSYCKGFEKIANLYGCDVNELIAYISSEKQVNYYRMTHNNKQ